MKRLLLAACAIACIGLGYALAQQTVIVQTLSGNEVWQVGNGAAGPGYYVTTPAMRGNTDAVIPTTTTFTQVISPQVSLVVVSGAITTLNLSLPAAPFDGQTITIACPGGVATTVNMSVGVATSASVITGPTFNTCNSNVATSLFATFVASLNNAAAGGGVSWNRIR